MAGRFVAIADEGGRELNYLYSVLAGILGIVAFFTGEIVSYVFLGFILIALNNIHKALQDISKKLDKN